MNSFRSLSICAVCLAGSVQGGELRLSNGAILPGELRGLEHDTLVWDADLIGEMKVPKDAVVSMHSTQRIDVMPDGHAPRKACLVSIDAGQASLACSDDVEAPQAPLMALREAPKEHQDSGKITVELDLERGSNATEDQLDIDSRFERTRGNRRHNFEGSIDYERNASRTTQDEAELLYQGDYLLGGGPYLYALTEYRRDRQASIQESLALGVGAGYEFSLRPDVDLRLQAGISEIDVNLVDTGKEYAEAGSLRWMARWQMPWHGLELSHEGQYGVVLEDRQIYLLETRSALSVPIAGGWISELRLDYDRYGVSSDGDGRADIEWVFALGYRW